MGQVISYQHELTSGMPKEIISQLRSTNVIIQTLTNRYGNKRGLVEGFKADLLSIKRPDENKDAAAADYVAAALAKLEYLLRLAREEGLVYELAMLRCEQVVLNTMRGHPTLRSFEMMFGRLYGEASRQSGFVSAEATFEILLTCLREADQALLYIKTTQTSSISYNAAVKRDNGGNATSSGHSGGGGGEGGGSNKKNKANGKQINQTAASKKQGGNGGNSNSGPPKQQRKCPYCASLVASHGHVLECRKFENVPAEMMYKFCHQLSACTSCLLTNQYTDWNKRGAWFTAHEPSCNRDFVCRVGNCDSKPPISQAHVVVCHEHHEDNKAKIDEFLLANQKYANLQYYAFPSHLKETDSAANKQEEKEVIPDTKDRACFTMQEVSDKEGGSLFVMYDSGAMTSAVTSAAAARLKAKTVQPGPISYTTFGGESRENNGGIVAFTLPMDDGRLISMSALVMDEITGYIPKQHMKDPC